MKPVQYFSSEYLAQTRNATPEQILEFLESFRLLQDDKPASKLISLKVPQPLLSAFRQKSEIEGLRYQTQIKHLMADWVNSNQ